MHGRLRARPARPARLARLAIAARLALLATLAALGACPAPRAPAPVASCPEARRLLDEAAVARAEGALLRGLARAETADRACASEATRRAVAEIRGELLGPEGAAATATAPAPGDAAEIRAAVALRLAGEPDHALARLRPIAARLDPAGLAELSRALAGSRRSAEARRALEQAAARAEVRSGGRGRWRWMSGDFGRLDGIAFTPDGARLVGADRAGWIRVWDGAGGQELFAIKTEDPPERVDVSPDGAWVAASQKLGAPEVWEVATGKRILVRPAGELRSEVARFTPEGHLVVRSKREGTIELELPAGRTLGALAIGEPSGLVIAGERIYAWEEAAGGRALVGVWARDGKRKLDEIAIATAGEIWDLAATPRGELVVLLGDRILIHDGKGKLRHTLPGARSAMALTPDGRQLIASTGDGDVEVLDVGAGQLIRRIEAGPDLSSVAIHPRGAVLATAGADGISLWSVASGERTARFGPPSPARAVAFDAGGGRLAVGSAAGAVTIWDLATGGQTTVTPRAGSPVAQVAFGPNGDLATASEPPPESRGPSARPASPGGLLAAWDGRGARRWAKELEHLVWMGYRPGTGALGVVAFTQAAPTSGYWLTLWDAQGGSHPAIEASNTTGFAWTPDGARLSFAHDSLEFRVAPLDGGRPAVLEAEGLLAAFQPGGGLLALASYEGRISLRDATAGGLERVIYDPSGNAVAIAWTPGGGAIAAAAGRTIRLWDPRTGARLATLEAHADVTAFAFRPDGRLLAAACDDGRVELWSVGDATLVAELAASRGGGGIVLAPDGAVDGAITDDDPLIWQAGGAALPARAVWDREARPGLLAARLASVAADAVPRPGLAGAAPVPVPPACLADLAGPGGRGRTLLISASAPDAGTLALCVGPEQRGRVARPFPACFLMDAASGAFRPRAPTPHEALLASDPAPARARLGGARLGGGQLEVCHAGACRRLAVPELADESIGDGEYLTAVGEDGRLAAVIIVSMVPPTGRPAGDAARGEPDVRGRSRRGAGASASATYAAVYDVAAGRRIRLIELGEGHRSLQLLGETLVASAPGCDRPCPPSLLLDARTGRRIGVVGSTQREDRSASWLNAARVGGDVWAFHSGDLPVITYQNVRTGRVVGQFERPSPCTRGRELRDCELRLISVGGGIAVIDEARDGGEIVLLDARGAIVARRHVPLCKP